MTTKALWGQLTDAIENSKYPFTTFINKQYIDFIDQLESANTLSRLYWTDLIHSRSNSSSPDDLADISGGFEF